MIDGEVIRLRQLRERALKARALAMAMDSNESSRNTAWARSAQNCWRIAKVVTGLLRGHPNLNCQRDYSPLSAAYDRLNAAFMAALARRQERSARVFCEQLWGLARELDDARALTRSAQLSDALGRAQLQMRRLLREFEAAALLEAGAQRKNAAQNVAALKSHPVRIGETPGKPANWPYLAL